MKKTEQIFKELAEKDFTLTTNPKELKEEDYWTVLQTAMQETAVQFAEWLKTAPKIKVIGSKGGIIQYHVFTMQEQFEIFNNEE